MFKENDKVLAPLWVGTISQQKELYPAVIRILKDENNKDYTAICYDYINGSVPLTETSENVIIPLT